MSAFSGPDIQAGKVIVLRGTRTDGPEVATSTTVSVASTMKAIEARPDRAPTRTRGRGSAGQRVPPRPNRPGAVAVPVLGTGAVADPNTTAAALPERGTRSINR